MKSLASRLVIVASALLAVGCPGETPSNSSDVGVIADASVTATDAGSKDGAARQDAGMSDGGATMDGATPAEQAIEIQVGLTPWLAAGSAYVGFVRSSDRLSLPIALSLREAPPGLQLAADGQISWTPRMDQAGTHFVTIEASDGATVATRTATIVVSSVTPQATLQIDAAAGGVLRVTDPMSPLFGVELEVPPGALEADTELTIASLSSAPPAASMGLPVDHPGIELLPSGLQFQQPVRLSTPYDPASRPSAAPASSLRMFNFLPRGGFPLGAPIWVPVESEVDTNLNVVTSTLTHFSTYFIYASGLPGFDVYQTPHFNIRYTTRTIFGLFSSTLAIDDSIWIEAGGPLATYDPAVPNQVEDLGAYLETAYDKYRRGGFPVAAATRYEIDLGSAPLSTATPGFQGMAGGGGLPFDLIINPAIPNFSGAQNPSTLPTMRLYFSQTIAHEFFHVVQANAISGRFLPSAWWQSVHARFWRHGWLQEATAEVMGRSVFPGSRQYIKNDIMAARPVNEGTDVGYEAWPFLAYLAHAHPTVRLPWRLFKRSNPEITSDDFGWSESGLEYFYRRLDELMPDEDYAQDFAFRYQSYRKNTHLPNIEDWFTRGPTSNVLNDAGGTAVHSTALALAAAPPTSLAPAVWPSTGGTNIRALRQGTALSYIVDLSRVRALPEQRTLELILSAEAPGATAEFEGVLYETPADGTPRVLQREIQPGDEVRLRLVELGAGSKLTLTFFRASDGARPSAPLEVFAEFEQWDLPLEDAHLYLQIGAIENGRTAHSRVAILGQDGNSLELLGSLPIDEGVLRQRETAVDPSDRRLFHLLRSGVGPTGLGLLHIHVSPPSLPVLAPWRALTGSYVSAEQTPDRNGVVARLTTGDWTTLRPMRLDERGRVTFGADVRSNAAFDSFAFIGGTEALLATSDDAAQVFNVAPPNHRISLAHEVALDCPGSRGGVFISPDGRYGYQLCRLGIDDAKILTYALDDVASIRVTRESLYGSELAQAIGNQGHVQVTEDSIVFGGRSAMQTKLYSLPRDSFTGDVGDLAEQTVDLTAFAQALYPERPPSRFANGYEGSWLAATPDGTMLIWSFARTRSNVPIPTVVQVFSADGSGGWQPVGLAEVGGFPYAFVGAIQ